MLSGNELKTFHVYLYGPERGPLDSTFEAAQARLARLPQLCLEPDGSFVWTRQSGGEQIFGMLYDAQGSIQYCDLQGHCLPDTWSELCAAICGRIDDRLEVLILPTRKLKDLQSFVAEDLTSSGA